MSNLSKTKNQLKKKLTFDDYSKPAKQQVSKPASKQKSKPVSIRTSKTARQQTSKVIDQLVGAPAGQQAIELASQAAGKPVRHNESKTANQYAGASKTTKNHDSLPESHNNSAQLGQHASKKVKATFYLSEDVEQALTDVFIKRLQEKNKTDKSALIAEAIRLLYKREMTQK